jgi:hypothetical protein
MDLKNPESPVVDTACKTSINYILDNILFPLSKKIADGAPKSGVLSKADTEEETVSQSLGKIKAKQDTTISDIGRKLDRTAVTGGSEE